MSRTRPLVLTGRGCRTSVAAPADDGPPAPPDPSSALHRGLEIGWPRKEERNALEAWDVWRADGDRRRCGTGLRSHGGGGPREEQAADPAARRPRSPGETRGQRGT